MLLLVAVFSLALLQTPWARDRLLALAQGALSDSGLALQMEGLEGFLPFQARVALVKLEDTDGTWLELDGVRLAWSPKHLFGGRVWIDEISVRRLSYARPPHLTESAAEPREEGPPGLPGLGNAWPALVVERLDVPRVILGAAVLGEPAELALLGRTELAADAGPSTLWISLRRTDQTTFDAELEARLQGADRLLRLRFEAFDTGGLVSTGLGLGEVGVWRAKLSGEAPLADWRGALTLEAGGLGSVETTLHLSSGQQRRLDLRGTISAGPIPLATDVGALLASPARFELVLQEAARSLRLERMRLTVEDAELEAEGALDLAEEHLRGKAHLHFSDLSSLPALAGRELSGVLDLDLEVAGRLRQPDLVLQARAEPLGAEGFRLDRLGAEIRAKMQRPWDGGYPGLHLAGEARVLGLVLAAAPDVPRQSLSLAWDADWLRPNRVEIHRLELTGAPLRAAVSGHIDPGLGAGRLALKAQAPDLSLLASGLSGGSSELKAQVMFQEHFDEAEVAANGRVTGLQGPPATVAAMIGSELSWGAKCRVEQLQDLAIDEFWMEGANARVEGQAGLASASGDINGRFRLEVPQLGPLGETLQTRLEGKARLDVDLAGKLDSLGLELGMEAGILRWQGRPVERLEALARVQNLLTTPGGTLHLEAGPADQRMRMDAAFALQDTSLSLSDLHLVAPASEFQGDLTVDLARLRTNGSLKGRIGELRALPAWLGTPEVGGELSAEAVLDSSGPASGLTLTARTEDFTIANVELEAGELELRVADLWREPRARGQLKGQGLVYGEQRVHDLSVDADGDMSQLRLAARASGGVPDFDLAAVADLALLANVTRFRLDKLSGEIAGEPLALDAPAEWRLDAEGWRLERMGLRLAGAQVSAEADFRSAILGADLEIKNLDLARSSAHGGPDLQGRADARLRIHGPASSLRGELDFSVAELGLAGEYASHLPPGSITLTARLDEQGLHTELLAEKVTEQPLKARLVLPLYLSLQPPFATLRQDRSMTGALEARLDLGRLGRLVELDGETLGGILTASLRVAGSPGSPVLSGPVELHSGRYESGTLGLLLQEVELEATASGRRLQITRLQATDGAGGRMTGNGWLEPRLNGDFPYEARIELRNSQLLRTDQARLTLSGSLGVEGDRQNARLSGRVTVNQGELRIPDRLGPDIPTLRVIEVHGEGPGDRPDGIRTAEPFDAKLDLEIDIPGRAFVRGRGLESEWRGNLSVTGQVASPRVLGNLRVQRGYFDFLGKRFALREGMIDFYGASPPLPRINLEAATEGRGIVAVLKLTGSALEPKLSLESEPKLPEDEVLARLLFDRPADEITAFQALQMAAAVQTLNGGGPDFFGQARDALGLHALDLGATEGSIRIGRYVGENVFFEVESGVGEASSTARAELELTPQLSVETSMDQESKSAFGINWKLDY